NWWLPKGNTHSKSVIELLKTTNGSIDMKAIVLFMSTKGYHSKTYYDLFNALVDSELVEEVSVNGKKGYRLKAD
ncbi:hypothetical protein ACFL0P_07325, partial [Candidatus Omnitrophota bacterium]